VVLIALTILEVAIYSHLIAPGLPQPRYEAHTQQSGPYIGILAGIPAMWWIVRRHTAGQRLHFSIWLVSLYFVIDFAILLALPTDWADVWPWVLGTVSTKYGAGLWAARQSPA